MIALSVRQPWAWFILHAGKRHENRCWPKRYRALQMGRLERAGGVVMLHASSGCGKGEYERACAFAAACGIMEFPAYDKMRRGGLVGIMRIAVFVESSDSPWYMGHGALVIEDDPRSIEFIPLKGELGFFDVPAGLRCSTLTDARGVTVTDYAIKRSRRATHNEPSQDIGQASLFPVS